MTHTTALLLLSGGPNSTCALHQTLHVVHEVHALYIDWQQPATHHQWRTAHRLCHRHAIPLHHTRVFLDPLLPTTPYNAITHRYAIFLALASAWAHSIWPSAASRAITIACTGEAAISDPYPLPIFFERMSRALDIPIVTPWIDHTQADVLRYALNGSPQLRRDVLHARTCTGAADTPCGRCPDCRLLALAQRAAGLTPITNADPP